MKKLFVFLVLIWGIMPHAQELQAEVQINHSQVAGSNDMVFKTLQKSLRDFINNTSWTGQRLQNFEKIKCNFAIVISEKPSSNVFNGSIVVQAVRPIYNSQYETPLININDNNFSFKYDENENLIFNNRQFSGKNLIDVISFYVYLVLGYDADSFKNKGGQKWFETAKQIAQNSQNKGFKGWSEMEGQRTRGALVNRLLRQDMDSFRNVYYSYHRLGLDNMASNQNSAALNTADALLKLKTYADDFQMNYPFNLFIDTKKEEIFNLFNSVHSASIDIAALKSLMSTFSPRDNDSKWDKWK